MATINRPSKAKSKPFTIGLAGFVKISAVEGVNLSSESRRMFAEFERKGMSAQKRREAIMAKHAKKALAPRKEPK